MEERRVLPSNLYDTEVGQQLRYECQQVMYSLLRAARDAIRERTKSEAQRASLFADYLRQVPDWSDAQLRQIEEYARGKFDGLDESYRRGLKVMAALSGVLRTHRVHLDRRPRLRAFLHQVFVVAADSPSVASQAVFERSEVLQVVAQDACRGALRVCLADTEKTAKEEGREPTRVVSSDSEVFAHLLPERAAHPPIDVRVEAEARESATPVARTEPAECGTPAAYGTERVRGASVNGNSHASVARGVSERGVSERGVDSVAESARGADERAGAERGSELVLPAEGSIVVRGERSVHRVEADGSVSSLLFSAEDGALPPTRPRTDDAESLLTFGGISFADPMDSITLVAQRQHAAAAAAAPPTPIAEEETPASSASEKEVPVASTLVFPVASEIRL